MIHSPLSRSHIHDGMDVRWLRHRLIRGGLIMTIPPWLMALALPFAGGRWHAAESLSVVFLWPIAYLVAMASGYRIALGARPWSMGRFLLIGAVVWIEWATATAALSSDPKGFLIVWFAVMIIGVVPLPFLFVVKGIVDRD